MLNVYQDGLAEALLNSKNEIAVLYGSPLSTIKKSKSFDGVQDVCGVLELIDKYIKDNYPNLEQKYKKFLKT